MLDDDEEWLDYAADGENPGPIILNELSSADGCDDVVMRERSGGSSGLVG